MSISCSFSLSNIDLHKYARLKRAAGKLNVLISVFPRLHLYIGHLNYKQHKLYSIVTFLFSSQLLEQTEKKKESVGVFCLILKIEILYNIKLAAVVFIQCFLSFSSSCAGTSVLLSPNCKDNKISIFNKQVFIYPIFTLRIIFYCILIEGNLYKYFSNMQFYPPLSLPFFFFSFHSK